MARIVRKIYKDTRGFTFLEVLISVVILGLIISPFLGTFVTSARYTVQAQQITAATYAGEDLLEDLVGRYYEDLIKKVYDEYHTGPQPYEPNDEFIVDIQCEPSGVHSLLAAGDCCYLHVIFGPDKVLMVRPDGIYFTADSNSNTITLSPTQLQVGSTTLPYSSGGKSVILIINTVEKADSTGINLSVPSGAHVVHYTDTAHKSVLPEELTGASITVFEGIDSYDTSLVRTIVSVYRASDDELLCVVEDYLRPTNWPEP